MSVPPEVAAVLRVLAKVALAVAAVLAARIAYHVYRVGRGRVDPNLRGAPPHWLIGNLDYYFRNRYAHVSPEWINEYGSTGRFRAVFGQDGVYTVDPVALASVLSRGDVFVRSPRVENVFAAVLGANGLLSLDGPHHRRVRRLLSPAFSATAVREMEPVFQDKAHEFKALLLEHVVAGDSPSDDIPDRDRVPGARRVNILDWTERCTMDVIGAAGFGYEPRTLEGHGDELAMAFSRAIDRILLPGFLSEMDIPPAIVEAMAVLRECRATMTRIATQLVEEKKRHIALEKSGDDGAKDILTRIVRTNSALSNDEKMDDVQVRSNVATILAAGSSTTAGALSHILWRLSLAPGVQSRLREELLTVEEENPSLDTISSLPFFDNVVRESLRLDPPANHTLRFTAEDTFLPVREPLVGRDGKKIEQVFIGKGSLVLLSFGEMQRDPAYWGPDAAEFNPDRWDRENCPSEPIPGVYSNLTSFIGGVHACIGYRFALAEIKMVIFHLVRNFEFAEAPSKPSIKFTVAVVARPEIEDHHGKTKLAELPLLVRPTAAAPEAAAADLWGAAPVGPRRGR